MNDNYTIQNYCYFDGKKFQEKELECSKCHRPKIIDVKFFYLGIILFIQKRIP